MTTKKKPTKESVKKPVKKTIKTKPLTATQKRVEIAKDTIKWLDIRKFKMKPGTYFKLPLRAVRVTDTNAKMDVALENVKKPCTVCALGGMFYSMVRKFDKVPVGVGSIEHASILNDRQYLASVDGGSIYDELADYFSRFQLGLIESAFECRDMVDYDYDSTDFDKANVLVMRAIEFGDAEKTPESRMRAIMNNIIKNKGQFRP